MPIYFFFLYFFSFIFKENCLITKQFFEDKISFNKCLENFLKFFQKEFGNKKPFLLYDFLRRNKQFNSYTPKTKTVYKMNEKYRHKNTSNHKDVDTIDVKYKKVLGIKNWKEGSDMHDDQVYFSQTSTRAFQKKHNEKKINKRFRRFIADSFISRFFRFFTTDKKAPELQSKSKLKHYTIEISEWDLFVSRYTLNIHFYC